MGTAIDTLLAHLPDDHHVSLCVAPVTGPPTYAHDADRRHYAASTMKTWLVIAAYRAADAGLVDLDAPVEVHAEFSSAHGDSTFTMAQDYDNDDQVWRRLGETVSLRWLCLRAIVRSSNLATNLVLEQVGLPAVRQTIQTLSLTGARVERGIEDTAARHAGLTNEVTAADLVRTYQQLHASSIASPEACREILAVHAAQQSYDGLPAGLGAAYRVAHKGGWVEGVTHDAGIVSRSDHDDEVIAICTTTPASVDGHALVRRFATAWAADQQSR